MDKRDFVSTDDVVENASSEVVENTESVISEVDKNDVSDTVENTVSDTKRKMRVNDLWYYLIFAFQSLYSIFVRISDFSFVVDVSLNDTSGMTLQIMKIISVTTARFMLWTGLYGIVATVFSKYFKSFHFWFTFATCLMTITSLIILLV